MRLLERQIASIGQRLVLLAPPGARIPRPFRNVWTDSDRHCDFVREIQRLRGSIYLRDGAVQPHHLSADGRHATPEDDRSWHLLMLGAPGRVTACAWYLEHEPTVSLQQLRARSCPLHTAPGWRDRMRTAVESELERARTEGLRYVEVGGWAVASDCPGTAEGLMLALTAFSLGRQFGGVLGLTTATVRHASSTILRRLGGLPLQAHGEELPMYYDHRYRCQMELLRFDSRAPSPRYSGLIERLKEQMAGVAVIAAPHVDAFATTLAASA